MACFRDAEALPFYIATDKEEEKSNHIQDKEQTRIRTTLNTKGSDDKDWGC
jgi:hypothetical protein